jgi:hypothetical protein
MMRPRRQPLHPAAQVVAIEFGVERRLQRMLLRRILESINRRDRRLREQGGGEQERECDQSAHVRGFYATTAQGTTGGLRRAGATGGA